MASVYPANQVYLLNSPMKARTLGILGMVVGFLVILLGKVTPDDRLVISDIPLNTIFVVMVGLYSLVIGLPTRVIMLVGLWMIPIHLLLVTVAWSGDVETGMFKYINFITSTSIAFIFFFDVIRRFGVAYVSRIVGVMLGVLLILAIVYKIKYGFFNRAVSFFLSGPIVFGRLMGMATIISLLYYKGIVKYVGAVVFTMAVAWTQSKAPVVFIIFVLLMIATFEFSNKERIWLVAIFVSAVVAVLIIVPMDTIAKFFSRFAMLYDLATSATSTVSEPSSGPASQGGEDVSSNDRVLFYMYSLHLIAVSPLGIGLGGWEKALPNDFVVWYPHNFFFELFTEGGVLLGMVASIPFMMFAFSRRKSFYYIGLFLFMAQQTSGSLVDARYLLLFSLLALTEKYFEEEVELSDFRARLVKRLPGTPLEKLKQLTEPGVIRVATGRFLRR
ncbi:membrane hypothetical protein [Gammaproteobacteria bacterium]